MANRIHQNDPLILEILSEGPLVLQLTTRGLMGRFPVLGDHFKLQEPRSKRRFQSFWYMLRTRSLAMLKKEQEECHVSTSLPSPTRRGYSYTNETDPIMFKILSKGPSVLQLAPNELIKSFPELKGYYKLEGLDNRRRFGSFWYSLRKRRLAKYKLLQAKDPKQQAPSAPSTTTIPARMSKKHPIMIKILSNAGVLELTTTALIEKFPALKGYYKLVGADNKKRFRSFWTVLRQRELAKKHKGNVEDKSNGTASSPPPPRSNTFVDDTPCPAVVTSNDSVKHISDRSSITSCCIKVVEQKVDSNHPP